MPAAAIYLCAARIRLSVQFQEELGVVPEFVRAALDPEETSYIDQDEEKEQVLVIADWFRVSSSAFREEEKYTRLLSSCSICSSSRFFMERFSIVWYHEGRRQHTSREEHRHETGLMVRIFLC